MVTYSVSLIILGIYILSIYLSQISHRRSWDIGKCLLQQCELSSIRVPSCARKWIDLRRHFRNFYKLKGNLETMLSQLGMTFEGRQHCGLDDAKNIARMLVKMIEDECAMVVNGRLRF